MRTRRAIATILTAMLATSLAAAAEGRDPAGLSDLLAEPPASGCPEAAIRVAPDASLHQAVSAAPPGASFCLEPGLHRLQRARPKDGQRFYGAPGAVMNGAVALSGFAEADGLWAAPAPVPRGERRKNEYCLPGFPRCDQPVAVFLDDAPLQHVDSRAAVGPGRFHYDYAARTVVLHADPGARRVEMAHAPFAFLGGARDVVIRGLVIEKYAPPIQYGAIGYNIPSDGWRVEGNLIRLNYALGVVVGSRSRVRRNRIEQNGEMGAGCVGRGILFEGNVIRANGYFAGLDPLWEGGGAKCAVTQGLVVRRNLLAENNGMGFWTDIDNVDSLYEANLVLRNRGGGLSHEISYRAEIRDNVFIDSGPAAPHWLWGCAIQIQDSQDVVARGNLVDMRGGGHGFCLIGQDRGAGARGRYETRRNLVRDNLFVAGPEADGGFGAIADHDPDGLAAGGNRIEANRYVAPDAGDDRWAWVDGFYAWPEYRRRSGQDRESVLTAGAPPAGIEEEIAAAAAEIVRAIREMPQDASLDASSEAGR